jgi:site-specific DNA-methyltransferase (adenine-specific)
LDVSKAIDNKAGSKKADRVIVEAGVSGSHENPTKAILNKGTPVEPEAQQWAGWGTALKPAHEPIVLARKPLIGTVAANVLEHGTGGLNIDGSRVGSEVLPPSKGEAESNGKYGDRVWDVPERTGRFPANIIHDGSDEVVAGFPNTGKSPKTYVRSVGTLDGERVAYSNIGEAAGTESLNYGDSGSAARFFYCAKASKRDRNEGLDGFEGQSNRINAPRTSEADKHSTVKANHHPTVKPTDLMRYLVKLITPPNGIVLDPFTGSGSTGKGAVIEGFNFIGIELDPDYVAIATARIQHQLDNIEPTP